MMNIIMIEKDRLTFSIEYDNIQRKFYKRVFDTVLNQEIEFAEITGKIDKALEPLPKFTEV